MRVAAALEAQELRNLVREAELLAAPSAPARKRRLSFRLRWSPAGS